MRHPLWILNSILFVLFIIILGFVFFSRVEVPVREDIEPTGAIKSVTKKVSEINIKKIYEHDLFDTVIKPVEVPKEPNYIAPLPMPPTAKPLHVPAEPVPQFLPPLKITLKGIIVLEHDESKNRAIVADAQTKKETIYRVGDIVEDAQLIKIFSNKVLFLRSNGQQEVLYLRPKDAQLDPAYALLGDWKDVVRKITDTNYSINVREFTFRITSLAQFLDLLDITPIYDKGQCVGCRIGDLTEVSLGTELGLQPGDTIVRINDIPATNNANRVAIYKNIVTMSPHDSIKVQLLRDNQPMTYTFTLEEKKERAASENIPPMSSSQEQINLLQERHTFAPTLREIRSRERNIMLQKGQAPKQHLTAPQINR